MSVPPDINAVFRDGTLTTTDLIMELIFGTADLTDPANADLRKVLKSYARDMAGVAV